jgi:hypothetical protein
VQLSSLRFYSGRWFLLSSGLLLAACALGGCNKLRQTDMSGLDAAGMQFEAVEQLRTLQVKDTEVQQLVLAHGAGTSDQTCVELVRIAHGRHQLFASGEAVAGLIDAGLQESSLIELARLDQLGLWAGEAQAMRLAGVSDQVIIEVARRRAAGQSTLSGSRIAALRNFGLPDRQLVAEIQRGTTDAQADQMIARRNALVGHSFVRQRGRRR